MARCDAGNGCTITCAAGCVCVYNEENRQCGCNCFGNLNEESKEEITLDNISLDTLISFSASEASLQGIAEFVNRFSSKPLEVTTESQSKKVSIDIKEVPFSKVLETLRNYL